MTQACHGPMSCRLCWKDGEHKEKDLHEGKWRLVNDPGYWGAADPEVLVLGMTKGTTQAREMAEAFRDGTFDQVAYAGFRPRLLQALQVVGLMKGIDNLAPYLTAASRDSGFASIVRCSLTARDAEAAYRGNSGPVIRGMRSPEGGEVMARCVSEHLSKLGNRTKLVVLLGNDDNYIRAVKEAVTRAFGQYEAIPGADDVGFRVDGRTFVHIAHPSPLNGHFTTFRSGPEDTVQGRKRIAACAAVEQAFA